jgi:hypothetical protein
MLGPACTLTGSSTAGKPHSSVPSAESDTKGKQELEFIILNGPSKTKINYDILCAKKGTCYAHSFI